MRVALIGSQDFGKAALEAFLERGDEIVPDEGAEAGDEGEEGEE